MVQHANLTGLDLHEPKGVDSAEFGQLYFADGAGSGLWLSVNDVLLNANVATLSANFADISTAETVYIPTSWACDVYKVSICLQAPITTANSVVSVFDASGNSMGSINITYSGSAAGQIFTLEPVSNYSIAENSFLKITTDGGSSGVAKAIIAVDVAYTYG